MYILSRWFYIASIVVARVKQLVVARARYTTMALQLTGSGSTVHPALLVCVLVVARFRHALLLTDI